MKFYKYILMTAIMSMIILICLGLFVCFPKNLWHMSYQSMIQDKYQRLIDTEQPKIVLVGGSNLAFGIDEQLLEDETGFKVVNLGLHAGFGHLFVSELSKANINKGDIVILAYEHSWYREGVFPSFGTDLVMSGIDDHVDMYQYIPSSKWRSVVGYLGTYAMKKIWMIINPTTFQGIYSRASFDPHTLKMIVDRPECIMDLDEKRGTEDISDAKISAYSKNYLIKYKKYIEDQGASVYFADTPILDISLACDEKHFYEFHDKEEREIGIQYITAPEKYFFPAEYLYDSVNHCNNLGQIIRTELLIKDMKESRILN